MGDLLARNVAILSQATRLLKTIALVQPPQDITIRTATRHDPVAVGAVRSNRPGIKG